MVGQEWGLGNNVAARTRIDVTELFKWSLRYTCAGRNRVMITAAAKESAILTNQGYDWKCPWIIWFAISKTERHASGLPGVEHRR